MINHLKIHKNIFDKFNDMSNLAKTENTSKKNLNVSTHNATSYKPNTSMGENKFECEGT